MAYYNEGNTDSESVKSSTSESITPFITLANGKRVAIDRLTLYDLDISSIVISLSHICRFGGHCRPFYSVAEHSVRLSREVPNYPLMKAALIHDMGEAYIGDVTSFVKAKYCSELSNIEKTIQALLAQRFNIPLSLYDDLRPFEAKLFATECRDLFPKDADFRMLKDGEPVLPMEPLCEKIFPWTPATAINEFTAAIRKYLNVYFD